jgi:hypothetical protein
MTNDSQDLSKAPALAMNIFRGLTGVIVGVIVAVGSAFAFYRMAFAILLKMNDDILVDLPIGFWASTLGYDLLAGLLGGFAAGWIAGRRPTLHGILVGISLVALTVWTMKGSTGEEPSWFFPGAMVVGFLGGAGGGALRALLAKR